MLGKVLFFLGSGILALVCVIGFPSPGHAQNRIRSSSRGFRPGFNRGFFDPRLSRGRFDRFDRFEDRFESRFSFDRFDRFEDRFENRFLFGGFDPRFNRGFFDPRFSGGFFDPRFSR